MIGFGYCIWYCISILDGIYALQKKIITLLHTPDFIPHITLQSHLNNVNLHQHSCIQQKYAFFISGVPYTSETIVKGWSQPFYCIELPLINKYNNKTYHVSLAYRLKDKFTAEEMKKVLHLYSLYHPYISGLSIDGSIHICNAQSENFSSWKI
jgi:hypothetical protein